MTEKINYHFRLYIVSSSPSAKRAIANFQKIFKSPNENQIKLEIVDVMRDPAMAENDRIIAVPALVRLSPLPIIKIIGDLADTISVCTFFGFD